MSKDVIAVGMWVCRHCRTVLTPAVESHRDDKAPDDKIRHVLKAINCFWTSSLAQLSEKFGHL